jgi:O-acetyl-ADP-ribose deacetylase (regulator of RNase III)
MTVLVTYQSVFDAQAQALVVTVNCVGVMGKGVAEICKRRYPLVFIDYVRRCRSGKVKPGRISNEDCYQLPDGRYIILFPTKNHWRRNTEACWVETGLADLLLHCHRLSLDDVALPPPGCGNGGLELTEVQPMIDLMFEDEDIEVTLCI